MTAYQNVIGGTPVANLAKPPEGTKASSLKYVMTSTDYSRSENLSLWADLGMSQVISLVIDNTGCNQDVIVEGGAILQSIIVPANTGAIVPTFSPTGSYSYTISLAEPPGSDQTVVLSLLNYERPPTTWGGLISRVSSSAAIGSNFLAAGTVSMNLLLPTQLLVANPARRDFSIAYTWGAAPVALYIYFDTPGTLTIAALLTDTTAAYITGSQIFQNISYTGDLFVATNNATTSVWGAEF
jgi:hypothetical protein